METRTCTTCGTVFVRPDGKDKARISNAVWAARKFCSQRCAATRPRPWRRTGDWTPKACANCGVMFTRPTGEDGRLRITDAQWEKQRFCSLRCARTGEHHWNWKGGRTLDSKGYVRVFIPDDHPLVAMRLPGIGRNVGLEHRLVMAEHLGRPLFPYEQVHHRNGNKQDNRIENLELRIGPHGTGATEAHCPTCTCFN